MSDFTLSITKWYRQNKRNLPWRNTSDPYKIWLSEIILQQTRVDQGLAYYEKFIRHYPTVIDLANTDEHNVLNDWQGLGYYSRARNLLHSARMVRDDFNGKFPDNYHDISKLKGVGRYTAAAIASFAFGEKKAVVDGNVYRLLSRCFDIATPIDSTAGVKEFQALADELITDENPGEHNQAIMELGSVICSPKPQCDLCPLSDQCLSRANSTINDRPVKSKRTKVRDRYFHYLVYSDGKETFLEQRRHKDIWQQLYQFPLIELPSANQTPVKDTLKQASFSSETVTHVLSHQRIHAIFHHFNHLPDVPGESWIRVTHDTIQDYPLPRIIDRYLENKPMD